MRLRKGRATLTNPTPPGLALLAMAIYICRYTLEVFFSLDCAGHKQTPFRLYNQIAWSAHSLTDLDCRIFFPYYFHISWKNSSHSRKNSMMQLTTLQRYCQWRTCHVQFTKHDGESCICMQSACVASAACTWHYLQLTTLQRHCQWRTCHVQIPKTWWWVMYMSAICLCS